MISKSKHVKTFGEQFQLVYAKAVSLTNKPEIEEK